MSNEAAFIEYLDTPIGILMLCFNSEFELTVAEFRERGQTLPPNNSAEIKEVQDAVQQIEEYFDGKRKEFQMKLSPDGTDFQKRVWKQLEEIKFGKTKSYQQMANELGDPKVIRAAASANGKNPIAVVIPCHRVIGSDGSLTGYASGLHRKKWLLEHESPVKQQSLF